MKVAVSASGTGIDVSVDPRFGRCPYFVIVDTETMSFETVANTSMNAPSGAGIGAAQLVAERGVEAVLTGAVGPNAAAVLSQAGIRVATGARGTVRQAVEAFNSGELGSTPFWYGGGGAFGGRGGGRGMGRRMGGGRGMGMYPYRPPPPIQPTPAPATKDQEIETLTRQLQELEKQLREVRRRLEEMKR